MAKIEANSSHILALDKVYGKLGYKILYCDDMCEDKEYSDNTLIQIRVLDGRDYMLDVWLLQYPDSDDYYVYSAIAVDCESMGPQCLQRWLDSAVTLV